MNGNGKWPLVPLGEVLKPTSRRIPVLAETEYELLGARWYAKGLYTKDKKPGSEIKASHLYQVQEGDFVYNRLFAWKGSFAVATGQNDGCFVSNEFPCFHVLRERLLPNFLWYYFSRETAWNEVLGESYGATPTSRNRLKESHLLRLKIPLPPLEEQRRIVALVDSLVAKIEEAKTLRKQSTSQLNAVAVSLAHRGDLTDDQKLRMGWKAIRLGDFIRTEYDDYKVQTYDEYPNLGIYSYGRGLFVKAPISGMATSAAKLRKVHSGQFIYSRLFAWEGAFGLVTPEFDGWYVSGEYPTFACDQHHILPEFLFAYFKTEQAWKKVAIGSKGLGSRRQRVQPEQILNHCLLLPPMDTQEKIKRTLEAAAKGRIQIIEAETSIDVLLPSILDRAFQGGL